MIRTSILPLYVYTLLPYFYIRIRITILHPYTYYYLLPPIRIRTYRSLSPFPVIYRIYAPYRVYTVIAHIIIVTAIVLLRFLICGYYYLYESKDTCAPIVLLESPVWVVP